jgi:dihydrofolate reductase
METRKVVLYIAMSLDGYIAKEDNDIGFLSVVEKEDEDYGYNAFVKTIDTVIMGRKTYDKILSFGIEFPHKNRKCYVLSHSKKGKGQHVEFFDGAVEELITKIRKSEGLDIFCDGGAEVIFQLMKLNLIDKYIISVIPVLLGSGIALFKAGRPEKNLRLTRSVTFPSGLVQIWYERE